MISSIALMLAFAGLVYVCVKPWFMMARIQAENAAYVRILEEMKGAPQDKNQPVLATLPTKSRVVDKKIRSPNSTVEGTSPAQDDPAPLQVVTSNRRHHATSNVDGAETHPGRLVDEAVASTSIASDTTANAGPHSDLWHDDVGFSDFKPDTVLEPTL